MIVISLLLLLSFIQQSASRECSPDEVACSTDGSCIHNELWCDGEFDCEDGSDESYCSSDTSRSNVTYWNRKSRLRAVMEAAKYLLKMRKSDYGWDDFTPRALIALSFAERFLHISEKEKALMSKRLEIQILLNLKRNGVKQNLVDLSLSINALYATCQNPRNFHGMDLVGLLRSETNAVNASTFDLPIVLMTLCLAKETEPRDFEMLVSMYDSKSHRVGSKALTVLAMTACVYRATSDHFVDDLHTRMRDFIVNSRIHVIDVYSEAFVQQALYAMGYDASHLRHDMLTHQLPDGSFGDLLSTYSAVPVLLNTSLLDLKCKGHTYDETPIGLLLSSNSPEKQMEYSLWIADNSDIITHTLLLALEENKTLYDAMKVAEAKDPIYRFMYDETNLGKKVYSLGGIPNDAETGMLWTLYRGNVGRVVVNSMDGLQKEKYGVDQIFPKNGSYFVFWMERSRV